MNDDLTAVTTPRAAGAMAFETEIPTGWEQGRGAFGGLVIGTLIRAIEGASAGETSEARSLRSLTAQLCGPALPGTAAITVEALRQGSGVSTLAARMTQASGVVAYAVGVLGRARFERAARSFVERPSPPPWREVEPMPLNVLGSAPGFARFFEFRNLGPVPFTGARPDLPVASGWLRPRRPGALRDAAYIAAMVDAYWPTIFSVEPAPRPIATIAFTLDLVGDCVGLDPEAPLFYRARSEAERDGYVVEVRELWGEDGRLVAINHQTIVLIR